MATLNPYLNFNGNTEEAFNFYKSVFGGEFLGPINRFRDTPEASKVKPEDLDKVMHVNLQVGKDDYIMGTDALDYMGHKVTAGNNFHISINTDSKAEADKIYKKLAEGGTSTMPMENQFWGSYFGMLTDKFGIQWMVSYNEPKPE